MAQVPPSAAIGEVAMLPELEVLNELRLENDLTIRALALLLGRAQLPIATSTLQDLLTHERVPHPRTLRKLRRFLVRVARRPRRFGLRWAGPPLEGGHD
jgi:hypothetical protein